MSRAILEGVDITFDDDSRVRVLDAETYEASKRLVEESQNFTDSAFGESCVCGSTVGRLWLPPAPTHARATVRTIVARAFVALFYCPLIFFF